MPGYSATRGIALAKLSIEQALARAKSHAKRGEVVAAQVLYAGIMKAFPNNKKTQQRLYVNGHLYWMLLEIFKASSSTLSVPIIPPIVSWARYAQFLQHAFDWQM